MSKAVPSLAPSSDVEDTLHQASLAASEVTEQMLAQKLELEDKTRSVSMLQKALVSFYVVDSILSNRTSWQGKRERNESFTCSFFH